METHQIHHPPHPKSPPALREHVSDALGEVREVRYSGSAWYSNTPKLDDLTFYLSSLQTRLLVFRTVNYKLDKIYIYIPYLKETQLCIWGSTYEVDHEYNFDNGYNNFNDLRNGRGGFWKKQGG